jgi:hypothetical protein
VGIREERKRRKAQALSKEVTRTFIIDLSASLSTPSRKASLLQSVSLVNFNACPGGGENQ